MGLFGFGSKKGRKQKLSQKTDMERRIELVGYLREHKLLSDDLYVNVDGDTAIAVGEVDSLANKAKLILALGNTQGIAKVEDKLTLKPSAAEAKVVEAKKAAEEAAILAEFYEVKSGDSLSKIAKNHYGDAMKYPEIFEANKPMLSHPDKIYPGQILRLPKLG